MICELHPILEEQIIQLTTMLHETKMAVIKILAAGMSVISAVVAAGAFL